MANKNLESISREYIPMSKEQRRQLNEGLKQWYQLVNPPLPRYGRGNLIKMPLYF